MMVLEMDEWMTTQHLVDSPERVQIQAALYLLLGTECPEMSKARNSWRSGGVHNWTRPVPADWHTWHEVIGWAGEHDQSTLYTSTLYHDLGDECHLRPIES